MNVLSIGNSFSTDDHKWLYKLASSRGTDMKIINVYIGGLVCIGEAALGLVSVRETLTGSPIPGL